MSIFVLDVTHALIVDDAQRQEAVHHGLTVDDVAIEQHSWVRNFFFLYTTCGVVILQSFVDHKIFPRVLFLIYVMTLFKEGSM